jgi:hypothetical protein
MMKSFSTKHVPSAPARSFSRAVRKAVNWRTVFAVAAAMRKLQQKKRLTEPARLKQWAVTVRLDKRPGDKPTVKVAIHPASPPSS